MRTRSESGGRRAVLPQHSKTARPYSPRTGRLLASWSGAKNAPQVLAHRGEHVRHQLAGSKVILLEAGRMLAYPAAVLPSE
jgi:hypothetical protein